MEVHFRLEDICACSLLFFFMAVADSRVWTKIGKGPLEPDDEGII